MFEYYIEMKMAAKNLPIDPALAKEIIESAIPAANASLSSIRNHRVISFEKRLDDYTFLLKLTSKEKVNATRSLSSLSNALLNGKMGEYIAENAVYNGCVLSAKVIKEDFSTVTNIPDIRILNEVAAILFAKTEMKPKEKELARRYEEKLRSLVVEYINQKNEL